jgi:hypothetical protein
MITVTLDTNCADEMELIALMRQRGAHVALVNTTDLEARGSSFEVKLEALERVPEPGLWGEGGWGTSMWGGGPSVEYRDEAGDACCSNPFEATLAVVSNHSFPPSGQRSHLTPGQGRQLRDAMIFCAHVQHSRDLFVSRDIRAFVNEGRRERLESMFDTRILTPSEAADYFRGLTSRQ